ncbi:hypothetical protein FQV26_01395 [Planococcus sp. CPCC 101016]|uniref:hypothetical protein n=1 Tax=Planococcus sp. CPCC 101016 TaxID=2599617 RepID=UPI0011B657DA|nr:hypothetical protein [Planococcus sp. CPCC 101016]TWT06496.1 hypothetical protein FQV26_01395 [Planococcus sp. CPCC 101016]
MEAKMLKMVLLILGISSGVLSIGICVYVFNHSAADNVHSLLKLSFLLITATALSSLAVSNLRNSKRWEREE